jgi:hypothetical protein
VATPVQVLAVPLDVFLDLPLDRRLQSPAGAVTQNGV